MIYPKEFRIGDRTYKVEYRLVSSGTSSVRIGKNGVVLKLSRFAFGRRRDEMILKFLKWTKKKLDKVRTDNFVEPVYEDGGRIVTHNKVYDLNVYLAKGQRNSSVLKDGFWIKIGVSDPRKRKLIRELAEKVIIEDQTKYLKQTIDELNDLYFKERYKECRFKRTSSRFGSCSIHRNINIAFRLLFAPREVFRYVCIHELSHLKEFNHSKAFWGLVAQADPDFKEHEKWLKNSGFLLG